MKDEDAVLSLCQYYSRALMYEFTLNERDDEFVNRISDVSFHYFKILILDFVLKNPF